MICTGSEPVIPPIKGVAEGIKSGLVLTNREILDLDKIPENLVIVAAVLSGLKWVLFQQRGTAGYGY
jgi:dihydrolipoamide dehydrogenase